MTQSELNQLYKSIATDFKLATRKTELWELEYCYAVLHDLKKFMLFNYADTISLVLHDGTDIPLKAKKYHLGSVNRERNDRPGSFDWEDGEGQGLSVVITHTDHYRNSPNHQKEQFYDDLRITTWGPSGMDVEFNGLPSQSIKRYTAGGSGVDRVDFN